MDDLFELWSCIEQQTEHHGRDNVPGVRWLPSISPPAIDGMRAEVLLHDVHAYARIDWLPDTRRPFKMNSLIFIMTDDDLAFYYQYPVIAYPDNDFSLVLIKHLSATIKNNERRYQLNADGRGRVISGTFPDLYAAVSDLFS